ncbi:hypothetical protein BX616_002787 [Lobosporangium transversale]|uniref:BZIP domain-containing protein n=1 Tax=Lobosporangium transversale TaxID=64571 RepID=A0A1Y2GH20_9FUNG|nr:hypothetical protein BCR41DRAFT_360309 [Lobosporangium transversale]KAF9899903.1 hypothetical protein BX616_002787 [Lobosporangium transversale]ORZ07277.1 hypothetical protein BCR41DRAFT_360309 [Lobosporangium transversale]|eukprot:XP_021877940.1 hypothetical protein BCR41DRAFT_360309 [Lobosporangium transversale]
MSENPYLSLIANLNSESPVISSPEDYSAELSLWTNAEFTFDVPPGLGVFEQDSGFETLSSLNHPLLPTSTAAATPAASTLSTPVTPTKPAPKAIGHNPDSALDQQHLMEYLNLPHEESSRPLSLLERTRQRNPVNTDKVQTLPELQEQAAAINAFHSLLAAYSAQAQAQAQQQQQLQQPQSAQLQQQVQRSSGLPLLLPNIAPATAPTTPAAAKLLRQSMPQYKAASPSAKKQKTQIPAAIAPAGALVTLAPKSPTTPNATTIAAAAATVASTPFKEEKEKETIDKAEKTTTDLPSKDDPDYLQKLAAEEDKRRRNTAASARFRFKKKLREQALEQTAKEQTLRAETLEARVKELEMEVKWLRGLIVEKDSRLHEVSASLDEQTNKRVKLDTY